MNDRLQQNLADARIDLINAQTNLALVRKGNHPTKQWLAERAAEGMVCRALDRAWAAQIMANGVFQ